MPSVIRGNDNFDSANGGPNASAGAVGTYAHLGSASDISPGSTYAGSGLSWAGHAGGYGSSSNNLIVNAGTVSGTWRAVGYSSYASKTLFITLFLRIS